jgi:hypothetical protein
MIAACRQIGEVLLAKNWRMLRLLAGTIEHRHLRWAIASTADSVSETESA